MSVFGRSPRTLPAKTRLVHGDGSICASGSISPRGRCRGAAPLAGVAGLPRRGRSLRLRALVAGTPARELTSWTRTVVLPALPTSDVGATDTCDGRCPPLHLALCLLQQWEQRLSGSPPPGSPAVDAAAVATRARFAARLGQRFPPHPWVLPLLQLGPRHGPDLSGAPSPGFDVAGVLHPCPLLRRPMPASPRPRRFIAAPGEAGGLVLPRCRASHNPLRERWPLQAEAPAALQPVVRGAQLPGCPENLATVCSRSGP